MSVVNQSSLRGQESVLPGTPAAEPRAVRCKPLQGTINRMVVKANAALILMGHREKRFSRNYGNGTANYTCPDCGKEANLDAASKTVFGDAFETVCTTKLTK